MDRAPILLNRGVAGSKESCWGRKRSTSNYAVYTVEILINGFSFVLTFYEMAEIYWLLRQLLGHSLLSIINIYANFAELDLMNAHISCPVNKLV